MSFDLAPAPKTVDGLFAVPIDIDHVDAALRFDAATSTGQGDATMTFRTGPVAGSAVFDLRQAVTAAWLDGTSIDPSQLTHHDMGGGAGAEMRILAPPLAAGTTHTLRVQYGVAQPIGSPIQIVWSAGPRLVFRFGFSDLSPARYLEQWIPANLIFDQFALSLDLELVNTTIAHTPITNGSVTNLGVNHWRIDFPSRFTALSPMLELRPSDSLSNLNGTVHLPVSGLDVGVEMWKLTSNPVSLATELANVQAWLAEFESSYGTYRHGDRCVVFLRDAGGNGMEYEGGTTSEGGVPVLRHEIFHSWFARGAKPASQSDGWWDEAFTVYHDQGANETAAFDFVASSPVTLASRNGYERSTDGDAYGAGYTFFKGIAAMIGAANLRSQMAAFYEGYRNRPATTMNLEELLLSRTGQTQIVEAFHRFVYGFGQPSPAPDLYLRDNPGDPGDANWDGPFWNSPDLWVRNDRDGGTGHQPPKANQDNYFYARVRNHSGQARHFVVTFNAKPFAGLEFQYPQDFLPSINAGAGFDVPAGGDVIVSALWPEASVPPAGTSTCILASLHAWGDHPVAGRHVWEDNSLAQKNVTVAPAASGEFALLPFVLDAAFDRVVDSFQLEIRSVRRDVEAALLLPRRAKRGRTPALPNDGCYLDVRAPRDWVDQIRAGVDPLDVGVDETWFGKGEPIPLKVRRGQPRRAALRVRVPKDAEPGERITVHLFKRNTSRGRKGAITGGITLDIDVTE